MAKRATATNWEVIIRDDEGAMVNIDFDCPHYGYSNGVFISVGASGVGAWMVAGRLTRFARCAIRMSSLSATDP